MNIVFLGPPGVGKGTIASKLAVEISHPHISTGIIFRTHISERTPLGLRVESILDSGNLVPDDLTIQIVADRLSQDDAREGFILDGFPRTVPQAEALQEMRPPAAVINFLLDDASLVRRLSGRRVHPASGRTYHLDFDPPLVAGHDDETGEELIQREDDREESIRTRLDVYHEQTQPLITWYRSRDLLLDLDAAPDPTAILQALKDLLGI